MLMGGAVYREFRVVPSHVFRLCPRSGKLRPAMKLYTYFRSSAAFRVRIALNLKGVAYEAVPRHLLRSGGEHRTADYLAVNPQGLIPALEDGGIVLTQSLAIVEYLEERFPEPALLPREAAHRAQVRAMALAIACDVHPLQNLSVTNYLSQELEQDDAAVDRWRIHWISKGLRALEELAKRHSGDGLHCFGRSVTLADVFLLPQLVSARRFKCDVEPYPTLRSIGGHLETLPAFAKAAPQAQPDAE
jgi:maleylacetoacetate isomerase